MSELVEAVDEVRRVVYEVMLGRATELDALQALARLRRAVMSMDIMPQLAQLNPRVQLSLIERVSLVQEELFDALNGAERGLRLGQPRAALKHLAEAEKALARLRLYMSAPRLSLKDTAAPLDATDIALECGSVLAAEVYGFVARRGRASRSAVSAAFAGREGLDEAISRLVSRGYLVVEEEGGEVYYRVGRV